MEELKQIVSEPAQPVPMNLGETQHPVTCGCWYCCTDATRSTPAAQPVSLEQLAEDIVYDLMSSWNYRSTKGHIERVLRVLQQATAEMVHKLEQERDAAFQKCETMRAALADLLLVSEQADETGYVDGEGWLPLEKIQEAAQKALTTPVSQINCNVANDNSN